jgi:hypothetical protein
LLLDQDFGGRWAEARERVLKDIGEAILAVRWPPGSEGFTIHPQSGKRRGEGSGVRPIKEAFVNHLLSLNWHRERAFPRKEEDVRRPGAFDAWVDLGAYGYKPFVAEWETGNISSSHRAMNKMSLGLLQGHLSGGVLVLPTRLLYQYLTDRVGNFEELVPYFPLWRALPVATGLLGVIAVEHDAASREVLRIPKMTDGRALI